MPTDAASPDDFISLSDALSTMQHHWRLPDAEVVKRAASLIRCGELIAYYLRSGQGMPTMVDEGFLWRQGRSAKAPEMRPARSWVTGSQRLQLAPGRPAEPAIVGPGALANAVGRITGVRAVSGELGSVCFLRVSVDELTKPETTQVHQLEAMPASAKNRQPAVGMPIAGLPSDDELSAEVRAYQPALRAISAVAKRYGVSDDTIRRRIKRHKEGGAMSTMRSLLEKR